MLILLFGHAFYAFAITAIGFFAAAITESTGTAAIVTLAFTIGSWVLDFAETGQIGLLPNLGSLSLTHLLREFEHGLLAWPTMLQAAALFGVLLGLAGIEMQTGMAAPRRVRSNGAIVLAGIVLFAMAGQVPLFTDVSEDRRNSFSPADEAALSRMTAPLTITLYLSPEDSRAREMESNVMAKLRRTVPHLTLRYGETGKIGLFGAASDDRYGLIVYEYAGKREGSRSSSAREILPILHALAGTTVRPVEAIPYPGYPLVVDAGLIGWWFYVGMPGLIGLAWWWYRKV